MNKYVGKKFKFNNKEWQSELEGEGIIIDNGETGIIECVAVEQDTFEFTYFDIKLDDGRKFHAMSGYHLELI